MPSKQRNQYTFKAYAKKVARRCGKKNPVTDIAPLPTGGVQEVYLYDTAYIKITSHLKKHQLRQGLEAVTCMTESGALKYVVCFTC